MSQTFEQGNARYLEGTGFREAFQFEQAIGAYKEALTILSQLSDLPLLIALHFDLALAYDFHNQPSQALNSFRDSISEYNQLRVRDPALVESFAGLIEQIEEQIAMVENGFNQNDQDYLDFVRVRPWSFDDMPVLVFVDQSADTGYDAALADLIWQGFAAWLTDGVRIRCERTSNKSKARITVQRVTDKLGPAAGQTLYEDTIDSEGNIWLEKVNIFMYSSSPKLDEIDALEKRKFASLACHEAGHALGIDGHSPSGTDLLYFKAPWEEPSKRDLRTLERVYE